MLSEISQSQKDKHYMIPLTTRLSRVIKFVKTKQNGGGLELAEREIGSCLNGQRHSVLQDEKVLKIDCSTVNILPNTMNCTLKNGQDGKYYVYSTTIKKKEKEKKKKGSSLGHAMEGGSLIILFNHGHRKQ